MKISLLTSIRIGFCLWQIEKLMKNPVSDPWPPLPHPTWAASSAEISVQDGSQGCRVTKTKRISYPYRAWTVLAMVCATTLLRDRGCCQKVFADVDSLTGGSGVFIRTIRSARGHSVPHAYGLYPYEMLKHLRFFYLVIKLDPPRGWGGVWRKTRI